MVDDNVDAVAALAAVLHFMGHNVETAHDGHEAVELARRYRPDFLLLDIGIPGLDGFQVAAMVRREPHLQATKIVAITGWASDEDRDRSREVGIDYHLVKPVDIGFLESLLGMVDRN